MLFANQLPDDSVVIIISGGFEEEPVVSCISQMREEGICVALVSLEPGLTRSLHGLSIRPDYRISQILPFSKPRLVVLPKGDECLNEIAMSPQVYELIENTIEVGGAIAIMKIPSLPPKFNDFLKSIDRPSILVQGDNKLSAFISQLINFAL